MIIPNGESTGQNTTPKDNEAGYQNAGVTTIPGAQPAGNTTPSTLYPTDVATPTTSPGEKPSQLLDW